MNQYRAFKGAYDRMTESISEEDMAKIDDKVIEVEDAVDNLSNIVLDMLDKSSEADLEEGLMNEATITLKKGDAVKVVNPEDPFYSITGNIHKVGTGKKKDAYVVAFKKSNGKDEYSSYNSDELIEESNTSNIDEGKAGKKVSKKSMKISNLADLKHYITRSFSITGKDKKDVDELNAMEQVMQSASWKDVKKVLDGFHWDKKDMDDLYTELISFALECANTFLEKGDDAEEEDVTDVDIEEVPEKCDKKKVDEATYDPVKMGHVVNDLKDQLDILLKANKSEKFVGLCNYDDTTALVFEKSLYVVYYDRANDRLVILISIAIFPVKKLAGIRMATGFKRG